MAQDHLYQEDHQTLTEIQQQEVEPKAIILAMELLPMAQMEVLLADQQDQIQVLLKLQDLQELKHNHVIHHHQHKVPTQLEPKVLEAVVAVEVVEVAAVAQEVLLEAVAVAEDLLEVVADNLN